MRPDRGGGVVPTIAMLVVGPILGLVFVVFLPLIGFVMVGWLLLEKALRLVLEAIRAGVRVVRPGWEPTRAFLSRSTGGVEAGRARDAWTEDARKKLEEGDHRAAD